LKIKSLGMDAKNLPQPIQSVKLLGYNGALEWKQLPESLVITCPAEMPFATAVTFRIE
jgi:alpha-L-fucosidase